MSDSRELGKTPDKRYTFKAPQSWEKKLLSIARKQGHSSVSTVIRQFIQEGLK